jgi:hypothetical protein
MVFTGLLFVSCQASSEVSGNGITYSGTMQQGTKTLNIALVIEKISKSGNISDCYYFYSNQDKKIILTAGIIDGDLILSEKGAMNVAKFIINDFDINKDLLTGIWVNQNKSTDTYIVKLNKRNFRT